jgi:glycosyltransferase involved in cell wall biosynthesis
MRVALLESFYTGSHKRWADGLAKHSSHDIQLVTLPGAHWKWRMHGSAVAFARLLTGSEQRPDALLVSDLTDVAALRGLLAREGWHLPVAVYFHENQITYPWSPGDPDPALRRDQHYGWINYTTALAADRVVFNSAYHRDSFLGALPGFLAQFPDAPELGTIEGIRGKSEVIAPGCDVEEALQWKEPKAEGSPIIVWNHRWEFDKNPEAFFRALIELAEESVEFRLVVLGEQFRHSPEIFREAKEKLSAHILHWGYCDSREAYYRWLWRAHVMPVTANQDFFGYSVVEGLYCGLAPLLPNRLAYPEHAADASTLYNNGEEFLPRLRDLLRDPSKYTAPHLTRNYSWTHVIGQYDRMLAELL